MRTFEVIRPLFLQAVLLYAPPISPNFHFRNDPSVGVFGSKFQRVQMVCHRESDEEGFKEA